MTPIEKIRACPTRIQATMLRIFYELEMMPMRHTSNDLSHALELHHDHVHRTLKRLRKLGVVRIASWRRREGSPIPLWGLGSEPDCARPELSPKSQKARDRLIYNTFRKRC